MSTGTSNLQSSGVQELIDRLRHEGVSSGQSEAERLQAEARVKAMEILDKAKSEAEQILANARAEAKSIEHNGKEALRLASRDVILRVREAFYEEFKSRLNRLVKHKLSDPKLLEKMILELAAQNRPSGNQQLQILLPSAQISESDLKKEVAHVAPGSLASFVLGLTADVLREGLSFAVTNDLDAGVKIQIVEDDVQIELSDKTITIVLLEYLVPRYRAIMQQD
jgi:V/A-type H+/Na+-transporting ATPase subunit E